MNVVWKLVPCEPQDDQQLAGAQAIRFDTTPINKLWTANKVYREMVAAAPGAPAELAASQEEVARLRGALEGLDRIGFLRSSSCATPEQMVVLACAREALK